MQVKHSYDGRHSTFLSALEQLSEQHNICVREFKGRWGFRGRHASLWRQKSEGPSSGPFRVQSVLPWTTQGKSFFFFFFFLAFKQRIFARFPLGRKEFKVAGDFNGKHVVAIRLNLILDTFYQFPLFMFSMCKILNARKVLLGTILITYLHFVIELSCLLLCWSLNYNLFLNYEIAKRNFVIDKQIIRI